jgi:ABC-type lipoprotein export system ATPase subunit
MSAREILVHCEDVARTYGEGPAAVVAVHGLTCRVHTGDRIAITGPSGSGKSTLVHLMAGLEQPTRGRVTWPGLSQDRTTFARQVGIVFQGPSLIPVLTVAENTALPLTLAGVSEGEADCRALAALTTVDAGDLAGKLPEEISGGQAQRVAVARVLALGPRLILADEPTGQLDQATGQRIIDVLLAAAAEIRATLVVTTHDPTVVERLPTRWAMQEGRLRTPQAPEAARSRAGQGES